MDSPFKQNLKIFVAILVSFILIWFLNNYKNISLEKVFEDTKNIASSLKSKINFLSLNFQTSLPKKQEKLQQKNFYILPTSNFTYPTKTSIIPTSVIFPTPTIFFQPTIIPSIPQSTKTPRPTKAPDVFPIDPSLARPGKTPDEVFQIASSKTCVPVAVLKGIAYIESGSFFDVVSPKYFLLYNSYNWWNSPYLTDPIRACGGYDYDSNTGLIPSDSKFAGYKCKDGSGSGLTTMGPLQVSDYYEGKFKPKAAHVLGVEKVDQRVILDAIVIVALSVKENVKPQNCNSWSAWEVAKAACSYYGSCGFKDGSYYCNTFCRNYSKFGGKGDCQGAVNKMQDNCWQ